MKKVKFIVFICLFILLPLAYFNGFIRISDLTSEQESIAKKYGGVYVFDEKLEKEIDKREEERDKYLDDFFKNNNRDFDLNDQAIMNEKLPRVLSNGKKYYLRWIDYENETRKKIKTPQIYKDKIKEFIGSEDYEKFKPSYDLGYFYIDDNDEVRVIDLSLDYYVVEITYTLSGDEASGIKFTKNRYINVAGDNYFYFIDNKFQKINK
ncbi:tRNA 2-selenouridine synthase [Campylobacter concisus]|uniref:tRNA 2-selenouridine synthase n=1 Tax=Campylobacter concisus TaxID=199 RepID=A0A7S9S9K1_9BACT|nr:tRNA 2-selenouridine synthase [Campylobacter concisus]QPI06182.1 tRNA 2-selenouridine synthase [Campylobacter concisus]